jgi:hypothetical protein
MALLLVLAYFFILCSLGMPLAKKINAQPIEQLVIAFLIGSIIAGFYMFALAQLHLVNNYWIYGFVGISTLITILNLKHTVLCVQKTGHFIKSYLIKNDKWSTAFIITLVILITWIILLAYTPPRSADAMRYHLPQIKDIVLHHGFIFRPYIHFHFPIYFNLVFLPIYILAKGVGLKLAICCYFLFSLLILQRIAFKTKLKYPRFLFIFLFLVPLAYHEAHIVTNDWVVIFYSLTGFLLLLESTTTCIYLAFAALGFALGVKYQAILFIPWFCLVAYLSFDKPKTLKSIFKLVGPLLLMAIIASPFYLKNLITFGNPVWPLAQNIFAKQHDYLYQIANHYTKEMSGSHSFNSLLINIKTFVKYPLIPISIWLLVIPGAIFSKKTNLRIGWGLLLYIITWWVVEPIFYVRFSIYALPIGMIAAINLYEYLTINKHMLLLLGYKLIAAVTLIYFIALTPYYSAFYVKYYFNRNLNAYHKYTWFYNDYQWMNTHITKNTTILCIVSAGQTYYLDKTYLRAEPTLSGLINWNNIKSTKQLLQKLKTLNVDYIFYSTDDWGSTLCGKNMEKITNKLLNSKFANIIFTHKVKLYASRIKNTYETNTTYLVKIKSRIK